jgi:G:T-mismatch repair DNA endonuclease (very short patch repair protein)
MYKNNYHHTEETRAQMSLSHKGVLLSATHRARIAESLKGKSNPRCYNQTSFKRGHITSLEIRQKISRANVGRIQSKEEKRRRTLKLIGRPVSEETRQKLSQIFSGRVVTEETRRKISKIGLALWQDPKHRAKQLMGLETTHKKFQQNPKYQMKVSDATKNLWQDPEYIIKQVRARGVKPNKAERILENVLIENHMDFKYNGDGRLGIALAGLVPDFVNVNGRKQVIELFGEYWHRLENIKWHQTEIGRVGAYKSIGWDCLVIWENELKKPEMVLSKIVEFSVGGSV